MRHELYATLRERIVKVVPEIMELKFGCKVKIVGANAFSGRIFNYVDGEMTVQPHPYEEDYLRSDGDSCGSCDFDKGEYEILGRDIQLVDCLEAIDATQRKLSSPFFFAIASDGYFHEMGGSFIFEKEISFNLALPLHKQSDEVGEWLLTVIK